MIALGAGLGFLIGLSLGILGGGGSILTVPIFVYVLGFGAKESIAMSLFVVGLVALFGAAGHWRAGNVNVRLGLTFGAFSMAGTFGGARLAVLFSGAAQLTLFAVVMLLAAVFMFRGTEALPDAVPPVPRPHLLELGLIGVEGLAVGVLTGLVGVGGGFLIVPALVLLGGVPMKVAVGTSLLVIALKSATGFMGYIDQVELEWGFMLVFSSIAVAGIAAGTRLIRYLPATALRRSFAVFLVVMGSFILYQNRFVLLELFS
ncbi:sulfite exporter TauE/SafE family protein [soil metagenome]